MAVLQALRHVVTAGQICIHGPAEDACSVVSLVWGPSQGCDLLQPINGAQHRLEMSKLHVGQSPPIPSDCCLWGCRQVCQAFRPSYSAPMHMQISENPHQQPLPCTLAHSEKACRRCGKAGGICCRLASCSRLASSMFMSIRSGPRKRSSIDCAAECTGVVYIALMLHAMHCLHADQYHQTGQCGL